MATVPTPADQHLTLPSVPWRAYERLLRIFADRPGVRLTYDRGLLEIMTLSYEHESQSYLLARLVDALTEELGLAVNGGRSTTFKRRKRQRGLEADSCWWIASEPLVRGKDRIDLRRDPPPDLAMEIDITHSSLNRLAIYARLSFPEVWRLENQSIVCYLLVSDGKYIVNNVSRAIPGFAVADLSPFLKLRGQMDNNAIVRQFRAWVRQRFGSGGQITP